LVVLPAGLDRLGLGGLARLSATVLRLPVLAVLLVSGVAVLYRFGPDRPRGRGTD
jgi:membrane protein